jgi:hypothetical protein
MDMDLKSMHVCHAHSEFRFSISPALYCDTKIVAQSPE